jgi:hypothetical protein
LWLDAADASTITESGGAVSQWNDKSGNGYNVSQGTGSAQPTTGTITRNGRNVISFDGNDFLAIGSTNLGRNVSGLTAYVVHRHATNPTTIKVYFRFSTNDVQVPRVTMDAGSTSQRSRLGGRTLDAVASVFINGSTVISTDWIVHTGVYDYSNTNIFGFINSLQDLSPTTFHAATTTSNTASGRMRIGATVTNTPAGFFVGEIAEILVFHETHDANLRLVMWNYLNEKWSIF